jgi:TolB-like protein
MRNSETIDVFVSYSAADRERVRPLVDALIEAGLQVWWDRRIAPGAGFDAEIQQALDGARSVLVIWSKQSVTSEWVIAEANEGLERGILIPVSIDDVRPPLAFRRRQTIALDPDGSAADNVVAAALAIVRGDAVAVLRSEYLPAGGESTRFPTRLPARRGRPAWLAAGVLAATTVIVGMAVVAWRSGEAPAQQKQSIAVLPFANLSGDPGQVHFADGLTDELLNSLAAIDELRVISRTSSFAVDHSRPLREVATILGVDHILEGSVRRAGDRIRVTAQLIDTGLDARLWSESYDRELTLENILQIQEEIARTVAESLEVKLFPRAHASPSSEGPRNLTALDQYHEGLFYVRQIETGQAEHPTTYEHAVDKLEASIEADPDWAPPRAALGEVYHFWMTPASDSAAKLRTAKRHILEALRLDDTYAPAYISLGFILMVEGDYEGAERAYDRSASLGGRWSAGTPWAKAMLLMVLDRHDEAVDSYREALARDPLSMSIRWQLARASYCAGRYTEVIDSAATLVRMVPDDVWPEVLLAMAHARVGNLEPGLEIADAQAERIGSQAPMAPLFALAGELERARSALSTLETIEPPLPPEVALITAVPTALVLGEADRALSMLEQVVADSSADPSRLLWVRMTLRCDPEVRNLAGNARYDAVLDRLGLSN